MSAATTATPAAPSAGVAAPVRGTVYVLCFTDALAHARHYVGWTTDLPRRIRQHRRGLSGAKLMEAVHAAGIGFEVVRTFEGTRHDERRLKNRGHTPDLCPCCRERPATPRGLEEIPVGLAFKGARA